MPSPRGTGFRFGRMQKPKFLEGFKNSLASKIAVWLLLLSLFPVGVILIFLGPNVSNEFLELGAHNIENDAKILSNRMQSEQANDSVSNLGQEVHHENYGIFAVDTSGLVVFSNDYSNEKTLLPDFVGNEAASQILQKNEGHIIDKAADRIIGFSKVKDKNLIAVVVADKFATTQSIHKINKIAFIQIGVSVLLIVIIGATAIMVLLKPVYTISKAAEQVGEGKMDIRLDASLMDGELEVLAKSFNKMAESLEKSNQEIEKSKANLEEKVAERTKELSEKNEELEKFNRMAVDRELKMVELKKKIKELENQQNNK